MTGAVVHDLLIVGLCVAIGGCIAVLMWKVMGS